MAIAFLSAERSKDPNRQVIFSIVLVYCSCKLLSVFFCNDEVIGNWHLLFGFFRWVPAW